MQDISLNRKFSIFTGKPIRQCRVVPLSIKGKKRAFLALYSSVFDVDPYVEMFFFPDDSLHFMAFTEDGAVLWKKDLGLGIVPGVWFCPFIAFDLDGDGDDEVYYVGNTEPAHPLGVSHYTLDCLDGRTGKFRKRILWPHVDEGREQNLSHQFRNFILGGYVHGKPRLVCVQGTYGDMFFECFDENLLVVWEHVVKKTDPGARGSHMCPVVDVNHDGVDEILWGERCIEIQFGKQLFCADETTYCGHSDIIMPLRMTDGRYHFFTCRETESTVGPRICDYNEKGELRWGALQEGHIDLGWAARLGDDHALYVMGVRVGHKVCGSTGRFHDKYEEFIFNEETGEQVKVPYQVYKTLPVDLNGDGYAEIVHGIPSSDGAVFDRFGKEHGNIGGCVALSGKLMEIPGEQMIVYSEDGTISMIHDENAHDSVFAEDRYGDCFYKHAQKLSGNGYNWCILGGI